MKAGQCNLIIGSSGSGKTVLMKCMVGLFEPDEGQILYGGQDFTAMDSKQRTEVRKEIGMLFQGSALFDSQTVEQNVMFPLDMFTKDPYSQKLKRVNEVLARVNLVDANKKFPSELSGGMKKRVALARTLIDIGFGSREALLIMDEPTNHLDLEMVEWLENYLNQQNITLLVVSHDRYFLDNVCNEIWEMDRSNLYTYKGDYENYLEKKSARIESELASIDKAKNLYRKELEWMRKQPKARTTKSKSKRHYRCVRSRTRFEKCH